jgi:hypothetical protein
MKFHAKSLIQRVVAKLPDWWANEVYYLMQRRWGGLQKIDPLPLISSIFAVSATFVRLLASRRP